MFSLVSLNQVAHHRNQGMQRMLSIFTDNVQQAIEQGGCLRVLRLRIDVRHRRN